MLPEAVMRERFLARDSAYDGRFLTAVLTTGIYCLPSCPARKPKPENVRFFFDEPAARSAGFRACKRCRPDRFYRGHDPDGEAVLRAARAAAQEPAAFTTTRDLASAVGTGQTRLTALWRRYYHASPAAWLSARRVLAAQRRLIHEGGSVLDAGLRSGFESASAFHECFRRHAGMTPGAYRRLRTRDAFTVALPEGYRLDETLRYLVRDEGGVAETLAGRRFSKAVELPHGPAVLQCAASPRGVRVQVAARRTPSPDDVAAAHRCIVRLFAVDKDPASFERAVRRSGQGRLVRGRAGLRIPRTATLFEGLTWTVVGQQVNLAFAHTMRRRLIALCGRRAPDGLRAHPGPAQVARLDPAELTRLQYTRRKAEYLIDLARAIVSGELELDEQTCDTAPTLEARLLAQRGLGPWSANYLLMRGYGFADCVPVGDAGLVAALERWFELDGRPGPDATRSLMGTFAPHRSLATFHLWQTLKDGA